MNLIKTFLLLLAVFVALPVISANLYIQYDPQCMDRLEYTNTETGQTASYVVYQIQINEHEKLILEVGLETQKYQTYLPSQAINCNNAIYSSEMAKSINQQFDKAFIVYQKGRKQYYISPVSFAAYFVHNEEKISYTSPQYEFELNLKKGIIGENIATNRQRAEVYFDGRLENQCSGAYVFRQFSLYTSNPHMDIIVVPEVGLVEVRNGRNSEDALQNMRRLDKVNDQYLSDYMDMVCLGIIPETVGLTANSTVYHPKPGSETLPQESDLQAKSPLIMSKKHTVQKKETLFRIAKQHNVSLNDLPKWNNLEKSNLIRPGDVLWLGQPVAEKETVVNQLQPKGAVGPDGLPAPYDVPGSDKFAWGEQETTLTERGAAYWEEYPSEYLVQPGETVASIAKKFGFTENRFRTMNNLQPIEEVKIGQRLFTSDCKPGTTRPSNYDSLNESYTTTYSNADIPPYESKINPTNDYYYNQRLLNDQQSRGGVTPRTSTESRTSSSSFEPYSSNTPKFYETPEANRIRTSPSSSNTFRYTTNEVTPRSLPGSNVPASYDYDQSTLPQSYDNVEPGRSTGVSNRATRTLHFVKEGQTLYDIARLYGISVERLRELNQITAGETIMPYQQIYVN